MTTPAEDWPSLRYERECGCSGRSRRRVSLEQLARESLSVALRHAQDRTEEDFAPEAATPPGAITLPGTFSGWKEATPLTTLLGAGAPRAFVERNKPRLYRVYQEFKQTPLYIGMAYRKSIRDRVLSHLGALLTKKGALSTHGAQLATASPAGLASEIKKLQILAAAVMAHPQAATIKVQHASVIPHPPHSLDAKFLHAFESALQILERPHSYVGSVRTFEEY